MQAENFDVKALLAMAHSPVRNYAIPGLTSWLIGGPSKQGTVRLFHSAREHQEAITPHSHRFDFLCWVLEGEVRNRIWTESFYHNDQAADTFQRTELLYRGDMGQYERGESKVARYSFYDYTYAAGQCYAMEAHQIHSIYFARRTRVLFFEGPTVKDKSVILEPYCDGEVIPTFKVEPWMFKREPS